MYMLGNNVHKHAKFQIDSSIDVYFTDHNVNSQRFFIKKKISMGIFLEINEVKILNVVCTC